MTTKEIQSKLIDHYSLAIERVEEAGTFEDAEDIVCEMRVYRGVCYCSRWFLNISICDESWVENNKDGFSYWGDTPDDATTIEQILSALQLRLDILKKEYSLSIETIKQ